MLLFISNCLCYKVVINFFLISLCMQKNYSDLEDTQPQLLRGILCLSGAKVMSLTSLRVSVRDFSGDTALREYVVEG